ncbi:hypothetical protein IMG5_125910, partial [Ichthyophthirius multifiliis]
LHQNKTIINEKVNNQILSNQIQIQQSQSGIHTQKYKQKKEIFILSWYKWTLIIYFSQTYLDIYNADCISISIQVYKTQKIKEYKISIQLNQDIKQVQQLGTFFFLILLLLGILNIEQFENLLIFRESRAAIIPEFLNLFYKRQIFSILKYPGTYQKTINSYFNESMSFVDSESVFQFQQLTGNMELQLQLQYISQILQRIMILFLQLNKEKLYNIGIIQI